MMRDIVRIDGDKCIGCGKCAKACAEGAIKMIDGKAVLVSDAHCDGLGACLPACPVNAISIETREAKPFAEPNQIAQPSNIVPNGIIPVSPCPGSGPRRIQHDASEAPVGRSPSRLSQWPIQLRLVPPSAPYFEECDLLVAADCSAFAYGNFHEDFIKDRIVVIGCPKLDPSDCWNKLKEIITMHSVRSITVTRMDVPCCSGIVNAVRNAVKSCGKTIPVKTFTIYADGSVEK